MPNREPRARFTVFPGFLAAGRSLSTVATYGDKLGNWRLRQEAAMLFGSRLLVAIAVLWASQAVAQETHDHPVPEKLGKVSFPVSCKAAVQPEFERAVALLHSFAYSAAREAFQNVAERDPQCAMAHWGIAMTYYHQLWEPPIAADAAARGQHEIEQAQRIGVATDRERGFIRAAGAVYQDANTVPYATRALNYQQAMAELAAQNKSVEVQVFYALALLANAPPTDKEHVRQKQAVNLLAPLYAAYPEHPGIPHYLIHACDNAELAPKGLPAARAYAKIAPSVPHALHMPSHIFTRLGLWDDSIASNLAASEAARKAGDTGEQLHAMDYLVYAYLQSGREADAAGVIAQLKAMPDLNDGSFKVGYAATVMPIRYVVERGQWAEAAQIAPPPASAPPHVTAIAVWARGVGLARSGHPADAASTIKELQRLQDSLRESGNEYWAALVGIMKREVMAWTSQAQGKQEDAVALLREAADEEDSIEKLPVTPGPIIPAREQLGDLLLEQDRPEQAAKEFQTALSGSPGRRGSLQGAVESADRLRAAKTN
jgi:tetratricopeptide (TPR) repeat protein